MTGTLELLIGPSGTGKSMMIAHTPRNIKRYSSRWTTREPRKSELVDVNHVAHSLEDALGIIQNEGIFRSEMSGAFVRPDVFLKKQAEGDICGYRRYPDPETGAHYGYSLNELKSRLDNGEEFVEQLADFNASEDVVTKLKGYDVKRYLVIGNPFEIRKRLMSRDEDDTRKKRNIHDFREYARNIDKFDWYYISNPEQITEWSEIEPILLKALKQINAGEKLEMEYDTYDHVFRSVVKYMNSETEEFRHANKKRVMKKLFEQLKYFKGPLVKTFPNIASEKPYSSLINSITSGNSGDYYKVNMLFALTLREFGYEKEANEIAEKFFVAVDKLRWRKDPSTLTEKLVQQDFGEMFSMIPDTHKIETLKRYPEIYTDFLKISKDDPKALDVCFYGFIMGNKEERYNSVPGLLQLLTVRSANFYKLFRDTELSEDKIKSFRFDAHLTQAMKIFSTVDIANMRNRDINQKLINLPVPNIFDEEVVKAPKDFEIDPLLLSGVYSKVMSEQDFMLSGLSLLPNFFMKNLGYHFINETLLRLMVSTNRLILEDLVAEQHKPFLGFMAYNFMKNSYEIMKADRNFPNMTNNITSYPVAFNEHQLINTYWRESLLSGEEYMDLFAISLQSYLKMTEEDEEYKNQMMKSEKQSYKKLCETSEKFLQRI